MYIVMYISPGCKFVYVCVRVKANSAAMPAVLLYRMYAKRVNLRVSTSVKISFHVTYQRVFMKANRNIMLCNSPIVRGEYFLFHLKFSSGKVFNEIEGLNEDIPGIENRMKKKPLLCIWFLSRGSWLVAYIDRKNKKLYLKSYAIIQVIPIFMWME